MMKRLLVLVAAMTLAGCDLDVVGPREESSPSDPATETFAADLKIDIATMTKTPAGTYYKDVTVGTGATLTGNGVVVMSHLGLLKNGSVFSTAVQQTVILGNLVGGLQDAMPGMKVGGERIIVIPSALGYGEFAIGGIPANSTLVFDVKLDQIP